jgi:hypothetical protein
VVSGRCLAAHDSANFKLTPALERNRPKAALIALVAYGSLWRPKDQKARYLPPSPPAVLVAPQRDRASSVEESATFSAPVGIIASRPALEGNQE